MSKSTSPSPAGSKLRLRMQAVHSALALAAIPALMFGTSAAAQQSGDSAQSNTIQEVVVTARRVNERLQDVPQSVSAVSHATLQDNHIEAVYDLKGIVPDLVEQKTSTLGGGLLYIRGVVGQALPNATLDTRVGVYIDGVYIARPEGVNTGLADIGSVEVLKGPQGTLFGRNVTAGAINFITAGPTGQFGGELDGSYGDYNQHRYKVTLNSPEFHGLSTRFTYSHDSQDGDVDNTAAGTSYGAAQLPSIGYSQSTRPAISKLGGHDDDAFFFAARYTGIDRLTVDYKFDYEDDREYSQELQNIGVFPGAVGCEVAGYYLGLSVDNCGVFNSGTGLAPTLGALTGYTGNTPLSFTKLNAKADDFSGGAIIRAIGHNLTTQYDLTDNLKLKSITAYRELTANGQIDTDGENYIANPAYYNAIPGSPGGVVAGEGFCGSCSFNRQASRQISEELQLIGKWGHFMDFLGGLYVFDEHSQGESFYSFNATPSLTYFGRGIPPLSNAPTQLYLSGFANGEFEHFASKSYAVFTHVTLHLTDKLDIAGGVRYTIDDKADHVPASIQAVISASPAAGGLGLNSAGTDPSVQYTRVTYDGTISYKVNPNFNVYSRYATAYLAGGFFNSTVYVPEDSWSEEVGVKSEWLDRRLRVNADYFYQSTQNSQDTGESAAGGIYVANIIGTTINKGVEVDTSFVPIRGLTLNGSMGYADVQYADDRQDPAPKWTASLSGQYDAARMQNGMYVSVKLDGQFVSRAYNLHYDAATPFTGIAPDGQATGGGYVPYSFPSNGTAPPTTDPGYNYWQLLHYLAHQPGGSVAWDPALHPATAEMSYVTALNRATESGDYWLANVRVGLIDIPVAGNKAKISAYVKNVFDVRGAGEGSNYGGFFGLIYEQDRTYGIDASLKF